MWRNHLVNMQWRLTHRRWRTPSPDKVSSRSQSPQTASLQEDKERISAQEADSGNTTAERSHSSWVLFLFLFFLLVLVQTQIQLIFSLDGSCISHISTLKSCWSISPTPPLENVFNLSQISSGSLSRRPAIRIKRRLDPLEIKLQPKRDATAPSYTDKPTEEARP